MVRWQIETRWQRFFQEMYFENNSWKALRISEFSFWPISEDQLGSLFILSHGGATVMTNLSGGVGHACVAISLPKNGCIGSSIAQKFADVEGIVCYSQVLVYEGSAGDMLKFILFE